MIETYHAKFSDAHGCEETVITNDGVILRMCIRGVQFEGADFNSLEPSQDTLQEQLRQFTLNHNELCSCRIECEIPIRISDHGGNSAATLSVELTLGEPAPKGWLDREELHIVLTSDHGRFAGSGRSGWFEGELLEIQSQLPDGVHMLACINCLYSDYSPCGHGAFGCMMCFRNLKAEYLTVKSKQDFWAVHKRYDRMVQETYLCPEFRRRILGTGYRG
jgi:hypothetical protein